MISFKNLVETGVSENEIAPTRRGIKFSNYISILLCISSALLFVIIPQNRNIGGLLEAVLSIFIFSIPIILNHFGYINLSRIYLCWAPPLLVTWAMIEGMKEITIVPVTAYDGLRIYLLALSCIPYLLLDRNSTPLFALGIFPCIGLLFFCDQILEYAGVGYIIKGVQDSGYSFTQTRSLVAYVVISGSCLSLRMIVDRIDTINTGLINELESKNRIIMQQAEKEVHKLNQQFKQSESNYRLLFEQATDAIMITDFNGNFLDVNTGMCSMLDYSKEELLQLNIEKILDSEQLKLNPIQYKDLHEGKQIINERILIRKDGSRVLVESKVRKVSSEAIMGISRDITERKNSELKLLKYNRELNLLNRITDASIKYKNEEGLLQELCNQLINEGDYRLAWIGKLGVDDFKNSIIPIIYCGKDKTSDYLKGLKIDLWNEMQRKGPSAQAILTGKSQIINQIVSANNYDAWRENASSFGFSSSIGLCIKINDQKKYVLNIYSNKLDSFDEKEVEILERITQNIGNAIRSIQASHERDIAKLNLQLAYERLNYHVSNTPLAVIEIDKELKISFWNKRAEELFSWSSDEVIGKNAHEILIHKEDVESAEQILEEMILSSINSSFMEVRSISKSKQVLICRWYYSILKDEKNNLQTILAFVSDLTEQKKTNFLLSERIKERTTLYKVSQLLSSALPEDDLFQELIKTLPPGWQYPEITEARLSIYEKVFQTSNFRETKDNLSAPVQIDDKVIGAIDIVYLEKRPQEKEGPFFTEERNLLNLIAEMLQLYLERKQEEAALVTAQAILSATINNTELFIWSVDKDFRYRMFNTPFEKHMNKQYGVIPKIGDTSVHPIEEANEKWQLRYKRAFLGESFSVEESINGADYKQLLSPVIEKNQIVGVSVFAENVTDRNKHERELAEANKKISELKVMALRSVMNPHFIFNVLNSIQYFIAKNDRQNAINYLSTFSKLIRMVLAHSVSDKIKLADELEMLKNYITLEKVRFEDKFSSYFEVHPSVEADNIYIPSLLIQPYIENAILHGLYNKKGTGKLVVRVWTEDDYLIFEIEDDGIGREAAAKLKMNGSQKYKSMGTSLTEERLRLINEQHEISVFFKDLIEQDQPCGTQVTIKVQYS